MESYSLYLDAFIQIMFVKSIYVLLVEIVGSFPLLYSFPLCECTRMDTKMSFEIKKQCMTTCEKF